MSRPSVVETAPGRGPLASYLRDINKTPLLSDEEVVTLARRIREGDGAARDHLIRANLRLVVRLARCYAGHGAALEDLIAEGNLGLVRAVEGFDASRTTRFSTYASYWIKQSMRRFLTGRARIIRLPAYIMTFLNKWRRAATRLEDDLGRAPTTEEVASALRLSRRKLKIIKRVLHLHGGGVHGNVISFDETMSAILDGSPEESLGRSEELRKVLRLVYRLGSRDAALLRLRFGLDGGDPQTLQQVGNRLGLKRERVRQLEREALARLADALEAG